MKQYKFDTVRNGEVELVLPISNGHTFIFSFSAAAYKKSKYIGLKLYFKNIMRYQASLDPKTPQITIWNTRYPISEPKPEDANIVVKVDKPFPTTCTTYINDKLIGNASMTTVNNEAGLVDMGGVFIGTTDAVAVTLTVFKYAELGNVDGFVQAMRNGQSSDFQNEGQTLADRGKGLTDGADSANSSSASSTLLSQEPADANWMKYSSTVAWSIAVELELKSVKANVQQMHDTLMREWVEERRDNISLNTYEYFVHSHRAAWPTAVLKHSSPNVLKGVRQRHAQVMMPVIIPSRLQGS